GAAEVAGDVVERNEVVAQGKGVAAAFGLGDAGTHEGSAFGVAPAQGDRPRQHDQIEPYRPCECERCGEQNTPRHGHAMRRLVLFDIDGTLLTARGAPRRAFHRAMLQVYGTAGPIATHPFDG